MDTLRAILLASFVSLAGCSVDPPAIQACVASVNQPCCADADCTDKRLPVCRIADVNRCVACYADGASDTCPAMSWCGKDPLGEPQCQQGCKSDSECAEANATRSGDESTKVLCNQAEHRCVQCRSATECPAGQFCTTEGFCRKGCDDRAGRFCDTAAGEVCCNNACVKLPSDEFNCGACGKSCDHTTTVGARCVGGACQYDGCKPGFSNCGKESSADRDGCETNITAVEHCGSCTDACASGPSAHGVADCSKGACTYTCEKGWASADAGGRDLDGCETDLATTDNCGALGTRCQNTHATSSTCAEGRCRYTCESGFKNCKALDSGNSGGCETSLATPDACGDCGVVCDSATAAARSCPTGLRCEYTCKAGRVNCNKASAGKDLDGCECEGTACCPDGGCMTVHKTGLTIGFKTTFTDCIAAATIDAAQAKKACLAYTGDAARCIDTYRDGQVVCTQMNTSASPCACWMWDAKPGHGRVKLSPSTSFDTCLAPAATDPEWG